VTTFLLVRHAATDAVGRVLSGRAPGVALNGAGRAQAAALAERLAGSGATAVYTSPLERARETADAVAARLAVPARPLDALTEIDFGEWTGRAWDALAGAERWTHFNSFRAGTSPPGGELALHAQARAVGALLELRDAHAAETVVVVSHADVLKAVLGHFLGIPIDLQRRLVLAPASVSALRVEPWDASVEFVNDACAAAGGVHFASQSSGK
jgi:broad specificity phosphatase PhoE